MTATGHEVATAAVQAAVASNEAVRLAEKAARRQRLEALDAARARGELPAPAEFVEAIAQAIAPVELVVRALGTPVPQGSHWARIIGRGAKARAIVVPNNEHALTAWRATVVSAAESAMTAAGWLTLTGPVEVTARFLLAKPRTVKRNLPTVAPDLDKLTRALGDALKTAGVISDDALIVDWRLSKRYTAGQQQPGVRVIVRSVDEVIL